MGAVRRLQDLFGPASEWIALVVAGVLLSGCAVWTCCVAISELLRVSIPALGRQPNRSSLAQSSPPRESVG